MNWRISLPAVVICLAVAVPIATAQDPDPLPVEGGELSGDDLEQLRQLREELTEAVIAGDVEKQIRYVTPEIVTIWQNNQVAKGHDGLRDLLGDIGEGEDKIFQGYRERPSSDDVEILPGGNVAIAHGSSIPHYKWMGMEFDLANHWSATLVKSDGGWKLASYHVSGNMVDNPLLDAAKQSIGWTAGIALLVGIVIGGLVGKRIGKSSASASP